MSIRRENRLGCISLSNSIFAEIIFDGMQLPQCKNLIWPATGRGRQIGIVPRFNERELGLYLDVKQKEETIDIEFNVIVFFGISIRRVTRVLADYIAAQVSTILGDPSMTITINIVGVKTRKNKARRNTKVVYQYESNG